MNSNYEELLKQEELLQNSSSQHGKNKKFLKIAIVIISISSILALCLTAYLLILPKNYCKISTNMKDAVFYINGRETKKFRFESPEKIQSAYSYIVSISVYLPEGKTYSLEIEPKCDNYSVKLATDATINKSKYTMSVKGGERTVIISGITITTTDKIKNFDVVINVNIS